MKAVRGCWNAAVLVEKFLRCGMYAWLVGRNLPGTKVYAAKCISFACACGAQVPVQAAGWHSRPLHVCTAGHPAHRFPDAGAGQVSLPTRGSARAGLCCPSTNERWSSSQHASLPALLSWLWILFACHDQKCCHRLPHSCTGAWRSQWRRTLKRRACSSSSLPFAGSTACCCARCRLRWRCDSGTPTWQKGARGAALLW